MSSPKQWTVHYTIRLDGGPMYVGTVHIPFQPTKHWQVELNEHISEQITAKMRSIWKEKS